MTVAIRSDSGKRLKLTPTPSRNPSTSSICGGGGSVGTGSSLDIASAIRLQNYNEETKLSFKRICPYFTNIN